MGGGAWPFLVRGVICLVNSDNERDSNILNRCRQDYDIEALHTRLFLGASVLISKMSLCRWSHTCLFV